MSGPNGRSALGLDFGAERDLRPAKPCCERIGPGQWCQLVIGHEGAHHSDAPVTDYPAAGTMAGRKIG